MSTDARGRLALAMGFVPDEDFRSVVEAFIEDDPDRSFAA